MVVARGSGPGRRGVQWVQGSVQQDEKSGDPLHNVGSTPNTTERYTYKWLEDDFDVMHFLTTIKNNNNEEMNC